MKRKRYLPFGYQMKEGQLVPHPQEASLVKEIEKAIMMSDLGINPSDDGRVIRLVFPELTEDRRKELVKEVKKKALSLIHI